ncbi:6908_t:CDS:1, partial [Cetraspora pellucida]
FEFSHSSWVRFVDIKSLNLAVDILNFSLVIYLFWYYYRRKPGGVPRRVFFITLFVSQIQLFFAYAYMCTLPVVDSIFNFLLGTVLSRTISSFFSKDDFADFLMGVEDKNSSIVETIECIRMQSDDGEVLRDFETVSINENEKDDDTTIVTPVK